MNVLRDAGFNERRCIARDVLGLYGCIVTVARYDSVQGTAPDDLQETLHLALRQCIDRHAALSVVVQDATTEKPTLARLHHIDIAQHLTILEPTVDHAEEILQNLLDTAHSQPLMNYERQPQWRVWVRPRADSSSCYIAFATSHAIMDGRSGTIFHQSLLKVLHGGAQTDTEPGIDINLAPALDKAAKFSISWSFLLRPLLEEMLPSDMASYLGLKSETIAWCGAQRRPTLPVDHGMLPTAVKVLLIQPDTLSRILAVCRKHKSKLTALLNFSISQSLAVVLRKRGQDYQHFTTSTPYDLRRNIPGATNRMANYVSAVDQTVTIDRNSSLEWEAIAHATTILQERSSTLDDQPIALLRYLSKIQEWVSKRATQPSKESFSVSNLGNFRVDHAHDWTISQMAFSQSADATGAPLNINVASSYNGPLCIAITWWPGMLGVDDEHDFAQEVCDDLLARLESIAA
ncbi:hypothetical protein AMS68_000105 [Peltaster fructicola]|uniref:Alcohol acetyltransferase n=1 Tax=Peltaster fructicola TaxID=286661 RepID=A0A6H0XIW3_9PEZI|nr:hypothetical protein AMS68_000105 [Peltaster fructicola]